MTKQRNTNIITLLRLFSIFFKAGTFTFAGGLAMLPVIQNDIVEKYKFMSKDDFMEYATLSQSLPGVIALNCAVFVGRHTAGTLGMFFSSFGAVFSAFVLMIAATILLQFIPQGGPFSGAMHAVRAAAAALILSAAFSLGRHNLKSAFSIIVMVVAFSLIAFFRVSAVIVIICAGIIGYIFNKVINKKNKPKEKN